MIYYDTILKEAANSLKNAKSPAITCHHVERSGSEIMTTSGERQERLGLLQRAIFTLKYGRNWLVIDGFHVGNIKSDRPVFISAGSAVAGDIYAPKILVAGLLCGFAMAKTLVVKVGGEIWGDVCAEALDLAEGGKLHGWYSSVNQENRSRLEGDDPAAMSLPDGASVSPKFLDRGLALDNSAVAAKAAQSSERVSIWRQLQAAVAAALQSRSELEYRFEDWVMELAGESMAEASQLRRALETAQVEANELKRVLAEIKEESSHKRNQAKSHSAELMLDQVLVAERDGTVEKLESRLRSRECELAEALGINADLSGRLAKMTERADILQARSESLEGALKESQHQSVELEEALLRWQELAAVTEQRVSDLELELKAATLETAKASTVEDILRSQGDKTETEWERVQAALSEIDEKRAKAHDESAPADLPKPARSVAPGRDAKAPQGSVEIQHLEIEEALSKSQSSDLNEKLARALGDAQLLQEQLLWTSASLKTTSLELEDARRLYQEQNESVERLHSRLEEKQALVDRWKNSVGRMTDMLYEAERKAREAESRVRLIEESRDAVVSTDDQETRQLRESLRQQQQQVEAFDAEVEALHGAIAAQRTHLAESQAMLVERDLALSQARAEAGEMARESEKVKTIAENRIRSLELELQLTKKQLARASRRLNRLRVAGEDERTARSEV